MTEALRNASPMPKAKKLPSSSRIAEYERLLEDLEDLAVVAERRDEPSISHQQFKAELKRDGIL